MELKGLLDLKVRWDLKVFRDLLVQTVLKDLKACKV
jgi:hypothetical protein